MAKDHRPIITLHVRTNPHTYIFNLYNPPPSTISRHVRRGVSKRVEDGRRPPALGANQPRNDCKAVFGMARPQGVEGSSMSGLGETLRSPWIPLAIRACQNPDKYAEGDTKIILAKAAIFASTAKVWELFFESLLQFATQLAFTSAAGKFHDQGETEWIVIRTSLWGHNDTPCRRSAPGRPIGRSGSGRPQGVMSGFSYY
jgi:hypothetical protein